MAPHDTDLTPVGVAVAALSLLMGPQLALALGTYSIVLVGCGAGILIGIFRMGPDVSRSRMLAFAAVALVITMGVTVPAAELLAAGLHAYLPWLPVEGAKGLVFPISVAVPAIGLSWLDFGAAAWGWLRTFVTRRIG